MNTINYVYIHNSLPICLFDRRIEWLNFLAFMNTGMVKIDVQEPLCRLTQNVLGIYQRVV